MVLTSDMSKRDRDEIAHHVLLSPPLPQPLLPAFGNASERRFPRDTRNRAGCPRPPGNEWLISGAKPSTSM